MAEYETVTQEIIRFLEKESKGYRTITNFKMKISVKLGDKIGVSKTSDNQEVIDTIKKIIPQPYIYTKVYSTGERKYVSTHAPVELCLRRIKENPPLTINQIASKLPFKKEELAHILNTLTSEGRIGVTIELKPGKKTNKWIFKFKLEENENSSQKKISSPTDPEFLSSELKQAYENLERGRGYVKIYEIRNYLNWERKQFDTLLETLWVQGDIELQTSNQDSLTKIQRDDSFLDRGNTLRLLLLWSDV